MRNLTATNGRLLMRAQYAITAIVLASLCCMVVSSASIAQTESCQRMPSADSRRAPVGIGTVVVHPALGGIILGYDIDQNGTEGLLSEFVALAGGKSNIAVETFDQRTGAIIKIVTEQMDSKNSWLTWGVFGNHVGLAEFEHVTHLYVDGRSYATLDPLSGNAITGRWTPALQKADIIQSIGQGQGFPNTAVLAFNNGANENSFVFSSNIAANTFGPIVNLTNSVFDANNSPVMAYDNGSHRAVLGSSLGCFGCSTTIGLADLVTGAVTEFPGLGLGFINGIAVDSTTGIACTATEDDFSIEFYNLAMQTGFLVILPGATSQAQSGMDVEFDPINKLFLIGQEFSSTAPTGSSIQVFDEAGNFVESLNGFSLPASPAYMALNPAKRLGYVIPSNLSILQSFTY
jgi:hypothetical protein